MVRDPATSDDRGSDRERIGRRAILRGTGASLIAASLAGCNTTEQRRYEADPAALAAEAGELGFVVEAADWAEVKRTETIANTTLEITLANYGATYDNDPVGVGVGATPTAEEAGQQLNPVATASFQELLTGEVGTGMREQLDLGIDTDAEWTRGPERAGSTSGELLDGQADVATFVGTTDEPEAVVIHLTRTIHRGDAVFVASGRTRSIDAGSDRPVVDPDGAFTPEEVDEGLALFLEALPLVIREEAPGLSEPGDGSEPTLELSLEEQGPFTADGEDAARVRATARDAEGNPLPGLSLVARQFTGRDTVERLEVENLGDGEYRIVVTDTVAGETGLVVRPEGSAASAEVSIPFDPGPPARFGVSDTETVPEPSRGPEDGPGKVDPVARPGEDLAGSFSLTLQDEFGNLVDPGEANFQLSADRDDVAIQTVVDRESRVVNVRATFDGTPDPPLETPENGWGNLTVDVAERQFLEQRERVTLRFPFVHFEQQPRRVDGKVRNTLRFYSLNFEPLGNYQLFLPIDPGLVDSVVNPDPDNGFGEPVTERGTGPDQDREGVYIYSEEPRPVEEVEQPTSEFVEVILSTEIDEDDIVELPTYWWLEFPPFEPIPPYRYPIPAKLLDPVTLCLTIWEGPETDENRVDQAISEMKDVFSSSVENCCPWVFFEVNRKEITEDEWDDIDDEDDGLSQFSAPHDTVEDDDGNEIEVPDLTDEEEALFSDDHHDDDCINAYYVPDIEGGLWGRAYGEITGGDDWTYDTNGQMDGDSVVINNDDRAGDNKTLVHELGHVVGELIDRDTDDVAGGKDNIQTDPAKPGTAGHWNEEQCDEISELLTD